jgi:RNA polymerase sigma-70 factor, ECF subfamily
VTVHAIDDDELLAQLAGGDADDALTSLYDRYERRLYALGQRLLGDAGLAEELVQETFVRLWRVAGRFDSARGSASTFIFTIARNIAIDLRRRPSSRPLAELDDTAKTDDQVDEIVLGLTVRDALDSLSEPQRAVVEAVYGRGERAVDLAEKFGVPEGTVRSRAFHGLRALADALDQRGYEHTPT